MPRSVLRIGTRGSALALAQAEFVRKAVHAALPQRSFELVPVTTSGDTHRGPLPPAGGKELFTREIHEQLSSGQIDLAVHSAKDLPARAPANVVLASVPQREDPRDVIVARTGLGLAKLAPGSQVGTSSARRGAQLRAMGKGLVPVPMRGNVDTRLRKLTDGEVHAIVVALAGLKRLGKVTNAAEPLSADQMLPAPGQGALAVECRVNDRDMRAALGAIEDPDARRAFEAERSFMLALGGDCTVPLGALAIPVGETLRMRGLVATLDGVHVVTAQLEGDDPEKLGLALAERLRDGGADDVMATARAQIEREAGRS